MFVSVQSKFLGFRPPVALWPALAIAAFGVWASNNSNTPIELKNVPTRGLDAFEASAVQVLRSGEAIVIRDDASGTRMVGAVRAAKQCLTCHETKRGELLGAFTYRFERL